MRRVCSIILCGIIIIASIAGCTPAQPTETQNDRKWIEYEKTCYIIDDKNKQIIGQTIFELKGWLEPEDTDIQESESSLKFDGYMNVEAYPVSKEEYPDSNPAFYVDEKDVFIGWHPVNLALEDIYCETNYMAFFSRKNPQWNYIIIIHGGESFLAVCADSEEDVWDNYRNFFIMGNED